MGQINSIPVVSQIKSLVQVISGDEVGARKTQEEFARKGIIVSQVRINKILYLWKLEWMVVNIFFWELVKFNGRSILTSV